MDTPLKQVCGVCHDEWLTEDEYNTHTCATTGFTPQQPEHLINSTTPDFAEIQQAAIARGAEEQAAEQAAEVVEPAPAEPQADPLTLN